jgi:hypothetical protein
VIGGHHAPVGRTLRCSDANQLRLLGFWPGRAAWRLPRLPRSGSLIDCWPVAITVPRAARVRPPQGDAYPQFLADEPCRHGSVIVADVELGPLAGQGIARGPYLSLAGAF